MEQESQQSLLSAIQYPSDLRRIPLEELPCVCQELRQYIIRELADTPGHFASSLGVVELTVALHYVFNTPEDRIVWDVGHQAYAHKILTGRREAFGTNRKLHGLRPFPSPEESEYDTCTSGHASNSISIALGMAVAAKREGSDRRVVAVIGDGSMSGGLAFEGLNNVSSAPNDLMVILNDNDMSIDHSVGGLKQYLHNLHTSHTYNHLRYLASKQLYKWKILNDKRVKNLIRFNNSIKMMINRRSNMFEGLSLRYFGSGDGHNVIQLVHTLRQIKDMTGPKMLHIHTVKGKGYPPAEKNPTLFHAPGRFCPETGEPITGNDGTQPPYYQEVFGKTLLELAGKNDRIVGVTPAMPTGCGMCIMQSEMPDRCFDVGIAEGHAVTFSAGMAKDGLMPFCNIYSSFAQRAYDNIIHDVAISRLNVVLCIDRAGLVGEDGPTHHGVFDLAALRPIPGLTIASPMDERELRHMMYTAQLANKGPFVIRYPRGRGTSKDWRCPMEELPTGKGRMLKDGKDIALLSLGPLGNVASEAIAEAEKERGLSVAHYDMRFLRPLDEELLHSIGQRFSRIITLEDGVRNGGFGSAVLEFMSDYGYRAQITRIGLPDTFVEHGSLAELHHLCGTDKDGIKKVILSTFEEP